MKRVSITFLALFIALLIDCAQGHPLQVASGTATLDGTGNYIIRLKFDTLAFALDQTPGDASDDAMMELLNGQADKLQSALGDAAGRLKRGVVVKTDRGDASIASIRFPDAIEVLRWKESHATAVLPV